MIVQIHLSNLLEVTVFPSGHGNFVYRDKFWKFYCTHEAEVSVEEKSDISTNFYLGSIAYKNLFANRL